MAAHGSSLLPRVERLTEWKEPSSLSPLRRQVAPAVLVALVAAAAPGISHAGPADGPPGRAAAEGGTPVSLNPMETNLMETNAPESNAPETRAAEAMPAGTAELSPSSDSLIVHPDPSTPLPERWRWALERGLPGGYWIGWGVEGGVRSPEVVLECPDGRSSCREVVSGEGVVSSDSHDPAADSPDAPSLGERVGGAAGGVPPVAFIFRVGGNGRTGAVEWIRLRSAGAPLDLGGRPLVWLGRAGTQESLAQLRGLYPGLGGAALKKQAVAAVALHEGEPGVVQTLRELLQAEASETVRTEAVKWLSRGQSGGPEVFDFFVATALGDPSSGVRHKAVSRLGRIGSPQTAAALVELARTAPYEDVRNEAVDQLAGNREALLQLSREARDPRVRRDAVRALARGRSEEVVPMLLAAALDDPIERVRREAAVQLAAFGSESARSALAQVAGTRPVSRVRSGSFRIVPGSR
ncbi:MAG TPA: HEAT repeat domain-containing protein [Longimicrobiaceae bacterium]|nr:HEAT repeat domain-containing protein [Longimicrobiaceae bacterium]